LLILEFLIPESEDATPQGEEAGVVTKDKKLEHQDQEEEVLEEVSWKW
jgi:hypothetical protein